MLNTEIKAGYRIHARTSGDEQPGSGVPMGTVDHMDGEKFIKLKRADSPDQRHHWIPLEWVDKVEGEEVFLNKSADEAKRGLLNERPHAA